MGIDEKITMVLKSQIILLTIIGGGIFLFSACEDQPPKPNKSSSSIISGKISSPPGSQSNITNNKSHQKTNTIEAEDNRLQLLEIEKNEQEKEHYNALGKIDPFESLFQEKPIESIPQVDNRPKRILTPLEKVGLNQLRLVAVIIMKSRRIAMVEEANGKGYEVTLGTYIGKNQGKVSQIKDSSIVVKELVKDYKGRLKERIQEIKLHKTDNGE